MEVLRWGVRGKNQNPWGVWCHKAKRGRVRSRFLLVCVFFLPSCFVVFGLLLCFVLGSPMRRWLFPATLPHPVRRRSRSTPLRCPCRSTSRHPPAPFTCRSGAHSAPQTPVGVPYSSDYCRSAADPGRRICRGNDAPWEASDGPEGGLLGGGPRWFGVADDTRASRWRESWLWWCVGPGGWCGPDCRGDPGFGGGGTSGLWRCVTGGIVRGTFLVVTPDLGTVRSFRWVQSVLLPGGEFPGVGGNPVV